jgi:hypothetical protein
MYWCICMYFAASNELYCFRLSGLHDSECVVSSRHSCLVSPRHSCSPDTHVWSAPYNHVRTDWSAPEKAVERHLPIPHTEPQTAAPTSCMRPAHALLVLPYLPGPSRPTRRWRHDIRSCSIHPRSLAWTWLTRAHGSCSVARSMVYAGLRI